MKSCMWAFRLQFCTKSILPVYHYFTQLLWKHQSNCITPQTRQKNLYHYIARNVGRYYQLWYQNYCAHYSLEFKLKIPWWMIGGVKMDKVPFWLITEPSPVQIFCLKNKIWLIHRCKTWQILPFLCWKQLLYIVV